jgi:hypothetical protein
MVRLGLLLFLCAGAWYVLAPAANVTGNPSPDREAEFKNKLLMQQAMERARFLLVQQSDAKQAVQVLEENISRINGNTAYLMLLRDAYRAYIRDLHLGNQGPLAQKYVDRLSILDGKAATDPHLRPEVSSAEVRIPPGAANASPTLQSKQEDVNSGVRSKVLAQLAQETPKKHGPLVDLIKKGLRPSAVRAKVEEDPFDPAYEMDRPTAVAPDKTVVARNYLAQAEEEFSQRRFGPARLLFEKAFAVDQGAVEPSRDRWAYCKLSHVVEQLNGANLGKEALPALQREVETAIALAPRLGDTGKWLLRELEQRQKGAPASGSANDHDPVAVQHYGQSQGWQVAETPHFRVFHNQPRDFVEQVAQVAERTRRYMFRKWFGGEARWESKCDLFLYANAEEYTRQTGVATGSPGHSRIESDPSGARVVSRRMDLHCDNPAMLHAVLPHETTHVVLAGMFGHFQVPRWVDEGIAVLAEPEDKVNLHKRNLIRCQRESTLFAARELLALQDYPPPRRISAFYAQSVLLVEFLSRQKSPTVFSDFVRDGLREGYEASLRKHYGYRDFNDLEERWNQYVVAEINRLNPSVAGR